MRGRGGRDGASAAAGAIKSLSEKFGHVGWAAAEHVIRMKDGGFAAVIDQDFGIGLLVLESE